MRNSKQLSYIKFNIQCGQLIWVHIPSKKDSLVNELKDNEMNIPKPSLKVPFVTNPHIRRG